MPQMRQLSLTKKGEKMKKFEKNKKINFVDENNVFVGYDTEQKCCENAGWFISNEKKVKVYDIIENKKDYDIEKYYFDKDFFEEITRTDCRIDKKRNNLVIFKLISPNLPTLYLHLYNHHNGYYSHGFESKIGNTEWRIGDL